MILFGKMKLVIEVPPKSLKDKRRRKFSFNIDEVTITYDAGSSEFKIGDRGFIHNPPLLGGSMETSGTILARFGPTSIRKKKK